ncbi:diguanylate cyclase (GGDEF)-like protein [Actinoplanes lutulentus]|uniref:Diguanylate cyclase (GGDEF)-like protein n=1 Tax=Actinoplanes lutulentus TaxID=1287878 RepID=A0A327YZS9_9ACTN|nr:GGDEF domain-containing protein [Actinoplanes lutulentus]MBB2944586.1 diguanylate cyclase (GGDEF)-like protein [Actinoplanes lutulentus]RAK27206.1 diguanylate cyclase (GGDEF)-like protein [Actinoplanes lutulentus]
MDELVNSIEALSDALLKIEDERSWNAAAELRNALAIEQAALALGDESLVARAQLCQANMRLRSGDVAAASAQIWQVHQWALSHDDRRLMARTHLVWSYIHQHLSDAEQALEQAVLAVELLDGDATTHMHIWHRTKLADALWAAGSMDAARIRYQQAEQLAVETGSPALLCLLNNYAYTEFDTGNQKRAEEVADRLLLLADERGEKLEPAYLDTVGWIQIGNGRFADAEATMHKCIERHEEGRYDAADALAMYLLTLARAQRGLGAYQRAQSTLDTSRGMCLERDLGDLLVRVHQEQAELHAAQGAFAEAFEAHKVFFSAYQSRHSLQREARTRTRQAMFETDEARQEAERFREQARRDQLTGLHNRRFVDERLPELIQSDPALTVALVDLDHFKQINDRLSHSVGDQVLVAVADLLARGVAGACPDGFAARIGGEEFLIVLPSTNPRRARTILDNIRRSVRAHDWAPITHGLPVTVSIGVAVSDEVPAPTQPTLLSTADSRLYAAKHAGRDRVVSATDHRGGTRGHAAHASAA